MRNALEEITDEEFTRLRALDAEFCACAQCRDDVITRALNKIRPRYVSGAPIGAAVTRAALAHHQVRTELAVVLLDAMRVVRAQPRHSLPTGTAAPG